MRCVTDSPPMAIDSVDTDIRRSVEGDIFRLHDELFLDVLFCECELNKTEVNDMFTVLEDLSAIVNPDSDVSSLEYDVVSQSVLTEVDRNLFALMNESHNKVTADGGQEEKVYLQRAAVFSSLSGILSALDAVEPISPKENSLRVLSEDL